MFEKNYHTSDRKRSDRTVLSAIGMMLLFLVAAGASFGAARYGGAFLGGTVGAFFQHNIAAAPSSQGEDSFALPAGNGGGSVLSSAAPQADRPDIAALVEQVMPSVVSITNFGLVEYQDWYGGTEVYENEGRGSGVIIRQNEEEVLIVTNYHVVSGATTLQVGFFDEASVDAYVMGADKEMDLALISVASRDIPPETFGQIHSAILGDSSKIRVGEPAIAIGNALGYGQSVTSGVISAMDREVTVDGFTNRLIQTDAAINPGNSGGALFNGAGDVIGINSVKFASTQVEGMGYAIPISDAEPVVEGLISAGAGVGAKAYLGIVGYDVTAEVSRMYQNLPIGIYVTQVISNTAAAQAGIVKGDVITSIEGVDVCAMKDLQKLLEEYTPGMEIQVTFQTPRGNRYVEQTVTVTLGKKAS